jgi:hypothetical protein
MWKRLGRDSLRGGKFWLEVILGEGESPLETDLMEIRISSNDEVDNIWRSLKLRITEHVGTELLEKLSNTELKLFTSAFLLPVVSFDSTNHTNGEYGNPRFSLWISPSNHSPLQPFPQAVIPRTFLRAKYFCKLTNRKKRMKISDDAASRHKQ